MDIRLLVAALVGTKQQRIGLEEGPFADLSTVSSAAGLLGRGPEMPSRFVSGLPEWAGTPVVVYLRVCVHAHALSQRHAHYPPPFPLSTGVT